MLHSRLPYFASFIERNLGIVYSDTNYFQLQNRLEDITRFFGMRDIDQLYERTLSGQDTQVHQLLLDVATNNETSFFRDPKIFKALQHDILPKALAAGAPVQIWSAASSTGQEVYSIAMTLREIGAPVANASQILGTDISSRVLERAKEGKYTQLEVQRGLPIAFLPKYFQKGQTEAWTVSEPLKQMVSFRKFNLLDPFVGLGPFDVIFCRNVLIYQRIESKVEIMRKLHAALKTGGVLVLGAGESLLGISDRFDQVPSHDVIYYRART